MKKIFLLCMLTCASLAYSSAAPKPTIKVAKKTDWYNLYPDNELYQECHSSGYGKFTTDYLIAYMRKHLLPAALERIDHANERISALENRLESVAAQVEGLSAQLAQLIALQIPKTASQTACATTAPVKK